MNINFTAPQIGFDPTSYSYDESAGVARLTITTNIPLRFTDATGALFYTEDGTATGGGGIIMIYFTLCACTRGKVIGRVVVVVVVIIVVVIVVIVHTKITKSGDLGT